MTILKEVPNPNQEDDDGQFPAVFLAFSHYVVVTVYYCDFAIYFWDYFSPLSPVKLHNHASLDSKHLAPSTGLKGQLIYDSIFKKQKKVS